MLTPAEKLVIRTAFTEGRGERGYTEAEYAFACEQFAEVKEQWLAWKGIVLGRAYIDDVDILTGTIKVVDAREAS